MNKIIILILCLCCAFTIARAEEGPALNQSDANNVGHVVDRKTGEHLSAGWRVYGRVDDDGLLFDRVARDVEKR